MDLLLAIGICLLLAFEPLAFGGVPEVAIFILESVAGIFFLAWAIGGIAHPRATIVFSPLLAPMLLFAALVAGQVILHRPAYWYDSWHKALLWAAYGMLLFLSSQVFRHDAWLGWFGIGATVFGFLVAMFAITQELAGNGRFYWVFPNMAGGNFFGPYANHAHYAGLMELLVPFPLVFAMAAFSPAPLRIAYAFIGAIMGTSIFLSKSRGGVVAFLVQLVALTIFSARGRSMRRQLTLLGFFGVLLVLWLVIVPPSGLWEGFTQVQEAGPGRIAVLKDSLKMVRQRPLLGWGFGNFAVVYPRFRSFYSDLTVNAAHDDFAEIAVETGMLGFALMIWFIYRLYHTGLRSVRHWRHDPDLSTALAALVSCTGLIVHSFMDFNLQVPANAALFFALTAVATARSGLRSSRRGHTESL